MAPARNSNIRRTIGSLRSLPTSWSTGHFRNSARRPNAANLDGQYHTLEGEVGYAISRTVSAKRWPPRRITQNAHETVREQPGGSPGLLGGSLSYAAPFELTGGHWLSSVSVEYARAVYDEPNPANDPNRSRIDQRWTLRHATGRFRCRTTFSAIISLGYINNGSNIAQFEYRNFYSLIALNYRF